MVADTLSANYARDDAEYGAEQSGTESEPEPETEAEAGVTPPSTASSVRGERFLLGFGTGVLACTLVGVALDVMVLGVAFGFVVGVALGTYLAVR